TTTRPTRWASSTRAAARPRARTSSGVSSALATPRTPSVPKRSVIVPPCRTRRHPAGDRRDRPRTASVDSALGVLRSLAGLLEPVLLGLLLPGVAGEEARLLEDGTEVGVDLDESAGDAVAQGAGLAR